MVDADGRRTTDGRTDGRRLDGYTISSLTGELIMRRMKKGLFILFDAEKHTVSYNGKAENIPIMPAHPRTHLYRR